MDITKLKELADRLGVTYHHNAGAAKIKEAIDAHLKELEYEAGEIKPEDKIDKEALLNTPIVPKTSEEYRKDLAKDARRRISRLVRCRITCMNPNKKEWEGEIISVGSAKWGTFKKYIPFDGRDWHIPRIIYDHLKERKCTVFYTVKDPRGQKVRKGRLIPEFSIEVLPPLTAQELAEMRKQQAMAQAS